LVSETIPAPSDEPKIAEGYRTLNPVGKSWISSRKKPKILQDFANVWGNFPVLSRTIYKVYGDKLHELNDVIKRSAFIHSRS